MSQHFFDLVERDAETEVWAQYGRTLAILCVDSCGFTRVTQSHGIFHFLQRLVVLRKLFTQVAQAQHAAKQGVRADNLFAAFEQPADALAAAVQLNAVLASSDLHLTDSERFQVCCGIGYGRVLDVGDRGTFGCEVNLAYKLGEDLAEGGEILITESCRQALDIGDLNLHRQECELAGLKLVYHRILS